MIDNSSCLTDKTLFLILFILLSFMHKGFSNPSHFFIEIKKKNIVVGKHAERNLRKQTLQTFSKNKIDLDEVLKIVASKEDENVLLYIHGVWGNISSYHKNSIKKLGGIKGVDKTISIIWHPGGLRYEPAWKRTIDKGKIIAPILQAIVSQKKNKYFLLCHSMGHRLLEGAMDEMDLSEMQFQTVFLMAPDLDIDVFSKKLFALPSIANKVILFNHKKDRMLKVSKMVHRRERLGLNAIEHLEDFKKIENLNLKDISSLKKGSGFSPTNHNYFKKHKVVLTLMEKEIVK